MNIAIALAGNPNSGKTTLFNALTGSNQYVGNWPGVTVEKKEGRLRGKRDVTVTDLPGIYSLSPYTPEEVVARNFLMDERPDVILNIVDATNLERNLYLTTQLMELGLPVVVALNMIDVVEKNGDTIDTRRLSRELGCPVVEISALKGKGVKEAAEEAVRAAEKAIEPITPGFSIDVEKALEEIEGIALAKIPENRKRWYGMKLFERDRDVLGKLELTTEEKNSVENIISDIEKKADDDSESIVTSERYSFVEAVAGKCIRKSGREKLTTSDKIDRVVTNRFLGLPIFAIIMAFVYWTAMVAVGTPATDWVNDNLFGDGFHLFSMGRWEYESVKEDYDGAAEIVDGFEAWTEEHGSTPSDTFTYTVVNDEDLSESIVSATLEDYKAALITLEEITEEPDPADYGVWVPGIPSLMESLLDFLHVSDEGFGRAIRGLILDGIVAGVGAVLGFVPQMLVLFFFLAFLEGCGYMARIAFVLDRIFRKFGLSGKSFIPMLIGTGCGVPAIMASRTIENEKDRRMTVMTTTFIPCSAKVPFIAMVAGAVFGGSAWVATSAYFLGMAAIVVSGIMLKKTATFSGEPAPFVMELPSYHLPPLRNILLSMWERGSSFVKKAGTIILLSTILVWVTSFFGFAPDGFRMLEENELEYSVLASIGRAFSWIFTPLGWGNWQAGVASLTGLVAKENIVGTMSILYGGSGSAQSAIRSAFTPISGYSFLVFNLLCAPCFAAMGAIGREMNSKKWTLFAIGYQTLFAYAVALMVNQFGLLIKGMTKGLDIVFLVASAFILCYMTYMLFLKKENKGGRL